ncbi:hypothetical protein ACPXCS_04860 [Streptomyces sp. DT190]|uniref:hypothetical protein n=1 Tax=unclassified Streptomyces TaxID=2593676 RepID=UPI003CEEED66
MTPWLRALRATGLVVALGAGAVVSPYGAERSHGAVLIHDEETGAGAVAAPSARPVPSGTAQPSRAGSRAGEGRQRPGRPQSTEEEPDAGDRTTAPGASREALPLPTAPTEPPVGEAAAARADRPVGPVLRILPLGSGLVLIGLGLGLAFVGLRLRRPGPF